MLQLRLLQPFHAWCVLLRVLAVALDGARITKRAVLRSSINAMDVSQHNTFGVAGCY
jgi:hypothetical protein